MERMYYVIHQLGHPGQSTIHPQIVHFAINLAHNLLQTRQHMKQIGKVESNFFPCPASKPLILLLPIFSPHTMCAMVPTIQCLPPEAFRPNGNAIGSAEHPSYNRYPRYTHQPKLAGIQGTLINPNYTSMTTINREASFKLLSYTQNYIGWLHLLCGHFSLRIQDSPTCPIRPSPTCSPN